VPFTDRARIHVEGGHGGGGCLSFRRERRVPRGGPDGGNGGRGGSVVLVADEAVADLSRFRHAVHHRAQAGAPGEGARKHGRSGTDLDVRVPPGTRVIRDDAVIATLTEPGERVAVARGGDGGVGNWAFRSSTRRAPRETVPGTAGEECWLTLELRLPVDVAIVGLPNSGKSALLRALTGARADVAPYPHTTTEPELGPLEDEDGRLWLVADLPGLAADGTARRGSHLGQLERARVLVHCLDAADPEPPEERLARAREGLAAFRPAGARELVVATHTDLAPAPGGVDVAVACEAGDGVPVLRARLVGLLRASAREALA
jgi:GTP-binding protein